MSMGKDGAGISGDEHGHKTESLLVLVDYGVPLTFSLGF